MKPMIVAKNREHLLDIISKEMKLHGNKCNLNHIDVSQITSMSYLFFNSKFNGNISHWNVSNVKYMVEMFYGSNFNTDISQWDVSNVTNMGMMFCYSNFKGDLSDWNPSSLEKDFQMFECSKVPLPYWAIYENYENKEELEKAINIYQLNKKLRNDLNKNNLKSKKAKI